MGTTLKRGHQLSSISIFKHLIRSTDANEDLLIGSCNNLPIKRSVLEAQKAGLDFIRPGVSGKDADRVSRDIIENAGYGEYFGHSLGHGVGVEIHEKPNLSPSSEFILKKGNVVTVEPGIYVPGKFGVRIEDFAVITENGAENMTHCPKELIIL